MNALRYCSAHTYTLFFHTVANRNNRQRPYHVEYTGSRPITEVKQRRARIVLGWVTAWEHRVPLPFCVYIFYFNLT